MPHDCIQSVPRHCVAIWFRPEHPCPVPAHGVIREGVLAGHPIARQTGVTGVMASETFVEDRSSESGSTILGYSAASQARSMSSSSSRPMIQRVDFPLQKHRQLECKLCRQTAGSGNPLRLADRAENERYGNHRPWAKYAHSTMDGEDVRVPVGKLCLLCLNCYQQLGYRLQRGSLSKYMEHVASHPVERAEKFERSLKLYVNKLQEDGPAKCRLKQKQEVLAGQFTMEDELRKGTKRSKHWIFVEKEHWDKAKRGPLPKGQVGPANG